MPVIESHFFSNLVLPFRDAVILTLPHCQVLAGRLSRMSESANACTNTTEVKVAMSLSLVELCRTHASRRNVVPTTRSKQRELHAQLHEPCRHGAIASKQLIHRAAQPAEGVCRPPHVETFQCVTSGG